jgi:hypothetical protein
LANFIEFLVNINFAPTASRVVPNFLNNYGDRKKRKNGEETGEPEGYFPAFFEEIRK